MQPLKANAVKSDARYVKHTRVGKKHASGSVKHALLKNVCFGYTLYMCEYPKAYSAEPPPCQGVLLRGVQHFCGEPVPRCVIFSFTVRF